MNNIRTQGNFGRMEMFFILIIMIVSGVHTYVKINQLNTRYAKFNVFQLYLNSFFK